MATKWVNKWIDRRENMWEKLIDKRKNERTKPKSVDYVWQRHSWMNQFTNESLQWKMRNERN